MTGEGFEDRRGGSDYNDGYEVSEPWFTTQCFPHDSIVCFARED